MLHSPLPFGIQAISGMDKFSEYRIISVILAALATLLLSTYTAHQIQSGFADWQGFERNTEWLFENFKREAWILWSLCKDVSHEVCKESEAINVWFYF